ncbi:MAG TPA: peptidoglycan-binding protein [Longimicrobium sp.]|jgi:peptidoglycan hydrolase-like protein with peptidoglycan-binding domain
MENRLIWLPKVLLDAGLKVSLTKGWEDRGVPGKEMGKVVGVMCHHTGTASNENMPTLELLKKGRSDLSGPLAQLGLGRDGTYYVVAAGFCNHAGPGEWKGTKTGNRSFIGIEAENRGTHLDFPWPKVQMDAYVRGVAAILKHIGTGADFCVAHREWALPAGRKADPVFSMTEFRAAVAKAMTAEPPPLIPAQEPHPGGRPTLRRGMTHPLVKVVQQRLGVSPAGVFGPQTEAAVRRFQREQKMVPDGIVGPQSWAALDALGAPPAPTPAPLHLASAPPAPPPQGSGDMPLEEAIAILREITGVGAGWGGDTTLAVQRALGAVYLLNPLDDVDGAAGPRTHAAWQIFRSAAGLPSNAAIDMTGARRLADAAQAPEGFMGKLAVDIPPEYEFRRGERAANRSRSVDAIAQVAAAQKLSRPQLAYVLATAEHESDRFATLEEYASGAAYEGRSDLGNTKPGDGRLFKGRGYVQLTGRNNYRQYAKRSGIHLELLPPVLMNWPALSAWVLVDGMTRGAYTGARLDRFVNANQRDFRNARRVVNGLDKADKIAAQAEAWLKDLP